MSNENVLKRLGREIRRRRTEQGVTLEQLGKRANLTANFIGSVEHGRRNPSVATIDSIARGLDVSIADLFGRSSKLSPGGFEAGLLYDGLSEQSQSVVMQLLRLLGEVKGDAS